MTPGQARLHEATLEAQGHDAACIDCGRLMRPKGTQPNGHVVRAADGLCDTCYRYARRNGGDLRAAVLEARARAAEANESGAFTSDQLYAMPPKLADYMLSRRRRGIPVKGLPYILWPANLRAPKEAPV